MPVQIKTDRKLHPFAKAWAGVQQSLAEKKARIMLLNNWSESTFHKKVTASLKNKLELTDIEANNISRVLEIDINELLN